MLKLLHTSDWHLGRALFGRKRYAEFEAFLDWLAETLERQGIDVLLVAGDVFDTGTPSNRAQELYYRFLCRVASSSCRHVVLIAGNHDSPTFLDAPRELLRALDVHVVGGAAENQDPADEVLVLRGERGDPELIVCAVPYLRDRDIRTAEAGESLEDKDRKLIDGIRGHYAAVAALAARRRAELGPDVPIVAMGHLFVAGGQTVEGDGVRELYVGTLARVAADIFPPCFDYVALGHLHAPQRVNGLETVRYSGSPLPMGFGEAGRPKSLCRVAFRGTAASVSLIDVPVFQELERVRGDWDAISSRLSELAAAGSRSWLEVVYEGDAVAGGLRERLEDAVSGTRMEILRIKDCRLIDRVLGRNREGDIGGEPGESGELGGLNEEDVFEWCLAVHDVPEDQRPELRAAYRDALRSLLEDDARAE